MICLMGRMLPAQVQYCVIMEFVQAPDYLVRHMSDGFGVILALPFDLRWYFWCEKMWEYAAGSVLIFTSARCGLRFNLH